MSNTSSIATLESISGLLNFVKRKYKEETKKNAWYKNSIYSFSDPKVPNSQLPYPVQWGDDLAQGGSMQVLKFDVQHTFIIYISNIIDKQQVTEWAIQ